MQEKSKLAAYVGFSVKSRNVVYGYENVIAAGRRVLLVLCDPSLGESSRKKILAFSERMKVETFFLKSDELSSYCGGKNVKCIGLTDPNLASAAQKELKNAIGGSNQ